MDGSIRLSAQERNVLLQEVRRGTDLHVHTGYGIDAPAQSELATLQIARNQAYYANVFWDISKSFQLSFQVDYRMTDWVSALPGRGTLFFTQFLWRF